MRENNAPVAAATAWNVNNITPVKGRIQHKEQEAPSDEEKAHTSEGKRGRLSVWGERGETISDDAAALMGKGKSPPL